MFPKQRGGNLSYRWFNPKSKPFQPCDNDRCGTSKCNDGKCGTDRCGVSKCNSQNGGGVNLPYRWFNPVAEPYNPCGSNYNMQRGGNLEFTNSPYTAFDNRKSGCSSCQSLQTCDPTSLPLPGQAGGNSFGAPFTVFTPGNSLQYSYPITEGPVFDHVGKNKFW